MQLGQGMRRRWGGTGEAGELGTFCVSIGVSLLHKPRRRQAAPARAPREGGSGRLLLLLLLLLLLSVLILSAVAEGAQSEPAGPGLCAADGRHLTTNQMTAIRPLREDSSLFLNICNFFYLRWWISNLLLNFRCICYFFWHCGSNVACPDDAFCNNSWFGSNLTFAGEL